MTADPLLPIRGARIAHLIESDGPGGAERMLADMTRELAAGGCPTVAFLPERGEGWLGARLQDAGVPVEHYRLDRPVSPRCVRELAAAFRAHDIALAHSHEFTMAIYNAWAARIAGIPHVITMHGSRYYAERLRRRVAMRCAVALSGGVAAVSHDLADHLRRDLHVPRDAITVIPNGVRAHGPSASTLRAELGLTPADRIIVAVGNLYPVKGHRYLIEALAQFKPPLRTHVVIAGRGDLEASLRTQAVALGIATHVHLLGLRDDVPNVLAAADVFVQPSLAEGLPLAMLEAMLAGRPVVASDVGEVGAVLADGAGLLVPSADPRALAAALQHLLADSPRARAMAERGHRRATQLYGIESMIARYAGIYSALLTGRESGRRAGGAPVHSVPPT